MAGVFRGTQLGKLEDSRAEGWGALGAASTPLRIPFVWAHALTRTKPAAAMPEDLPTSLWVPPQRI